MNINKLLEYLQLDKELNKLNKEFNEVEAVASYNKQRSILNEAQETVKKVNRDSEDIYAQMLSLISSYDATIKELNETASNIENVEDINEADFYTKNLERLSITLQQLSRDISLISAKIIEFKNSYTSSLSRGSSAKTKADALKDTFLKAKNDFTPRVAELRNKLSALEKSLAEDEKKEVETFKILKANKKYPPIVPVNSEKYCGGCSQALPNGALQTLNTQGWVHCPNCYRMNYKK